MHIGCRITQTDQDCVETLGTRYWRAVPGSRKGLRRRAGGDRVNDMTAETVKNAPLVCAPLFPTYSELRAAMRAFDGQPVKQIRDMINAIFDQTGTPQNPVDWSDPD